MAAYPRGFALANFEDRISSVTGPSSHTEQDPCTAIIQLLRRGKSKARFMTELYAALRRSKVMPEQADNAVARLESEGSVMIRDHFCADPHLAGVDLRVIAVVEQAEGEDAQLSAIRAIDETWNQWLNEYLANHRCG
jgi:hypothetical protein